MKRFLWYWQVFTLILNFVHGMLTAYHAAIQVPVDLFLHSSEPKLSLHHVDSSQDTLMTSVVMKDLDDLGH